jgi:hypothetical protein
MAKILSLWLVPCAVLSGGVAVAVVPVAGRLGDAMVRHSTLLPQVS